MAGIRQVEEGFGRQFGTDRAQDGEPSETGVEDPDRCLRACRHGGMASADHAAATGILPILACHSAGPVLCTEVPALSTATVTGMSFTSNS